MQRTSKQTSGTEGNSKQDAINKERQKMRVFEQKNSKIAPCLRSQLHVCFYNVCRWSNIEHAHSISQTTTTTTAGKNVLMCVFIVKSASVSLYSIWNVHAHARTSTSTWLPFQWMPHKIWWIWPFFILSITLFHFLLCFSRSFYSFRAGLSHALSAYTHSPRIRVTIIIVASNRCKRTHIDLGPVIWHFIFTRLMACARKTNDRKKRAHRALKGKNRLQSVWNSRRILF